MDRIDESVDFPNRNCPLNPNRFANLKDLPILPIHLISFFNYQLRRNMTPTIIIFWYWPRFSMFNLLLSGASGEKFDKIITSRSVTFIHPSNFYFWITRIKTLKILSSDWPDVLFARSKFCQKPKLLSKNRNSCQKNETFGNKKRLLSKIENFVRNSNFSQKSKFCEKENSKFFLKSLKNARF